MRRWGYGLAGLLAIAFFAGLVNPSDAPPEPSASQVTESQNPTPTASASDKEPASQTDEAATEEPSTEPTAELSPEVSESKPAATVAAPEPQPNRYEELLAQLIIADEFPSGYDRDFFRHWIDTDGDGCNARREVLIAEAIEAPVIGTDCELLGGLWYSVYDGVTTTDDGDFDVDHMVALKEAWESGAYAWDPNRRRAFANDLDTPQALIAVTASSNRSKSDRDPADWLPPLSSYHCQYVEDWMVVKIKWALSVDPREFAALRIVAAGC